MQVPKLSPVRQMCRVYPKRAYHLANDVKKSNHRVNVVRINETLPHTNADTLELIHIGEYQVVVKKGQFKAGDLAVYIQPDSVVPQIEPFKFIWENYVQLDGTVPERRRRITVRKFRKEWSEGLLLPVSEFGYRYTQPGSSSASVIPYPDSCNDFITVGDDVSDALGITHYDPDKGRESTAGENSNAPRRRYPKTLKGWFWFTLKKLGLDFRKLNDNYRDEVSFDVPVYDVEALKNYANSFRPGEYVVVTEKIHGSNARYMFLDGKQYAGSRTLWKSEKSSCVWRKALEQNPWIEEWCRANEGHTLYGEVTPTQGSFDYGCKSGEVKFFAFDVRTPEGEWIKPWMVDRATVSRTTRYPQQLYWTRMVPPLYQGPFDLEIIKKFVDGPSTVPGAKHIREGVVVAPAEERHVTGLGRLQLKIVSNAFLEKDSK